MARDLARVPNLRSVSVSPTPARDQPVHIATKDTSTFHSDASRVTRCREMVSRLTEQSA